MHELEVFFTVSLCNLEFLRKMNIFFLYKETIKHKIMRPCLVFYKDQSIFFYACILLYNPFVYVDENACQHVDDARET